MEVMAFGVCSFSLLQSLPSCRKWVVEPTHLNKMLVKMGSSSPNRAEHLNKKMKPPPRLMFEKISTKAVPCSICSSDAQDVLFGSFGPLEVVQSSRLTPKDESEMTISGAQNVSS